jgi:hypothetical protein
MSLFSSALGRIKSTKPTSAADIERKLADAEAALPDLERRHVTAALDAQCDVPGASEALVAARIALGEGQDRVRDLRAALAAQREQDALAEAAAKERLRQSQMASCREHLRLVEAGFDRLSEAFAIIAANWWTVVEQLEAAQAVWPIGMPQPQRLFFTAPELLLLVSKQLHRAGGQPPGKIAIGGHRLAFPGAVADAHEIHDPEAIPPLVDTVREKLNVIRQALRSGAPIVADRITDKAET